MQNSIWKLTALAGVVGVGLLIVMQAQNELQPDSKKIVKNDDAKKNDSKADDVDWKSNDQHEPDVDSNIIGPMVDDTSRNTVAKPSFFPDDDSQTPGLFAASNADRGTAGANDPVFAKINNAPAANAALAPATAPSLQPAQGFSEYSEFASQPETLSNSNDGEPQLLTLDASQDNDTPFFDSQSGNTQPGDNTADAQQLLQDARRAMELGELQSARALAVRADGLNATYSALDDRPDLVIREVDALLAQQSKSPFFDEAGSVRENESGIVPVAGVKPDESTPTKKDPFADQAEPLFTPTNEETPTGIFEPEINSTEKSAGLNEPTLTVDPFNKTNDSDTGPFSPDTETSDNSIRLLPDNPPKLLTDPTNGIGSQPLERLSLTADPLDSSPFEPNPNAIETLVSDQKKTALQPPQQIDDSPFGKQPDQDTAPTQLGSPDIGSPSNPLETNPLEASPFEANPLEANPVAQTKSSATTTVKRDQQPEKKEVRGDGVIPENGPAAEQRPEMTIEKVAPPQAILGKSMIYSIVVSNRGAADAAKVTVEDVIPLGCKLVGTIPQAELIGSKLIWRLGRMKSGQLKKIHVKVVPFTEGEVGSVAKVNFVAEVAARTEVRLPPRASIRVTATAPNQARVGEQVKLHFKIQNTGQTDANKMVLQNLIPAGFEHPAGADLTYEIGQIKAGDFVNVDLELKAIKEGTFVNRAIIKEDGNARTESKATIKVIDVRGLTLQSMPNRAGLVGQKNVHSFKVSNPTSIVVNNARAISRLPRQVRFVKADNGGQYNPTSHSVEWQLADLPSKDSITLSSTVMPTTFGKHSATLQVTQPNAAMTQIQSEILAKGIAALAINLKDVPATAEPGDEFKVEATITNRGTGPDSNVRFSLSLPSNLEFITSRGPVKSGILQTAAGKKTVPFAVIPEIGEQASATFQITLRARTAGRPKLRAEVSSQQLDDPVATEAAVVILDTQ